MSYQKIAKLLTDILDVYEDDITPELELTPEQGVEPLQLAMLVIACEKRFKLTIHDEDVHRFRTIQDIVQYIADSYEENDGNASESSDQERQAWYY